MRDGWGEPMVPPGLAGLAGTRPSSAQPSPRQPPRRDTAGCHTRPGFLGSLRGTVSDVIDVTTFEQHRRMLFGIAYHMLGSVADAEDLVQDTWVRCSQVSTTVDNPAG